MYVLSAGLNLNVEFTYEPMEKQVAFHESQHRFKIFCGGFGSGKTIAGAFEVITNALMWPKNLILVGRATYPELRDTTRKEILAFPVICDNKEHEFGSSPLVKSYNKADNSLILINGTEIIFRALDELDKVKSLNLGGYLVDEITEISEEMHLALNGRLRRKGVKHFGIGTTNPEGHDWVWKRYVAGADKIREWEHPTRFGTIKTFIAQKEDHFIVTASSEENPYLPEEYVPTLLTNYPEEWIKRYVYGSFDTFSGLVYHEFKDEAPQVVKPFPIPKEWYRFVALDYGYRNPTAVLWFAVSPKGKAYVYDEHYQAGRLVSETAEIVRAKTGTQPVQFYLGDPAMKQRSGASGINVFDEFAKYGLIIQPANNSVSAGINRVKEKFVNGSLVVFSSCTNLRTELGTYKWKDLKPGATQDAPEKPVKKNDHAVDALRYGCVYLYDTPIVHKKSYGFDYKFEKEEVIHWMAN